MCEDFSLLIFILHLEYQGSIKLRWVCKCWEAVLGLSCEVKIILSSANSATLVWGVVGWSAVYILYRIGDEIAPWGTPARIGDKFEKTDPTCVTKLRFSKYTYLKNKK